MDTHTSSSAQGKTAKNAGEYRQSNGKFLTASSREWATSKDKVIEDFRTLVMDGEQLLRSTAHLSEDAISVARERFEKRWNQAKAKLDDAQNAAMERGRRATAVAGDYVNENPWKAVGVAGAIGLLVGLLLSRRS